MGACMYDARMNACMCACTHVCMWYVRMYVCIFVCTYTYILIYIAFIYIHTRGGNFAAIRELPMCGLVRHSGGKSLFWYMAEHACNSCRCHLGDLSELGSARCQLEIRYKHSLTVLLAALCK